MFASSLGIFTNMGLENEKESSCKIFFVQVKSLHLWIFACLSILSIHAPGLVLGFLGAWSIASYGNGEGA